VFAETRSTHLMSSYTGSVAAEWAGITQLLSSQMAQMWSIIGSRNLPFLSRHSPRTICMSLDLLEATNPSWGILDPVRL
jgi:hypothetical protein